MERLVSTWITEEHRVELWWVEPVGRLSGGRHYIAVSEWTADGWVELYTEQTRGAVDAAERVARFLVSAGA